MTERDHKPYYVRRIDQQILDALLRIEELLKEFLILLPQPVETPPEAEKPKGGKRK